MDRIVPGLNPPIDSAQLWRSGAKLFEHSELMALELARDPFTLLFHTTRPRLLDILTPDDGRVVQFEPGIIVAETETGKLSITIQVENKAIIARFKLPGDALINLRFADEFYSLTEDAFQLSRDDKSGDLAVLAVRKVSAVLVWNPPDYACEFESTADMAARILNEI